jgi:hypothetical protein
MTVDHNYWFFREEFDRNNRESVISWAKWLQGKTLLDSYILLKESDKQIIVSELEKLRSKIKVKEDGSYQGDKGIIGQIVEMIHFGLKRNSRKGPDIPEAGIELKTTGVEKNKDGGWEAKERLTLTQINYDELIKLPATADASLILKGLRNSLIIVYFYNDGPPFKYSSKEMITIESMMSSKFTGAFLWNANQEILSEANRDLKLIKAMCESGYAHMISERYSEFMGCAPRGLGTQTKGKEAIDYSAQTVQEDQGEYNFKTNCSKLGIGDDCAQQIYKSISERSLKPRHKKNGYSLPPEGHHNLKLHGKYPKLKRAFTIPDASLTRVIRKNLNLE